MQLFLDYNRNLSPRWIAAKLGVSIGTVYAKIKNGVSTKQQSNIKRPPAQYSNTGYLSLIN